LAFGREPSRVSRPPALEAARKVAPRSFLLNGKTGYHRPFFEARPYIFENYLLNYMFRTLFPFGRARSADFIPRSIFDEYILMTTQFAIINGLLIGIAGHFKERFSEEHVVKTIQSFTREADHDPMALNSMVEFMHKTNLGNLVGLSVLLKN
jgi:lysine-N-methylase